jgi:hypothetical protein
MISRRGFYIPSVAIFALAAMSVMGFLLERNSAKLLLAIPAIRESEAAGNMRRGIKFAEDWLISSTIAGGLPRSSSAYIQNPFERIEAVGSGGFPIGQTPGNLAGMTLNVSDLDYTSGIFTGALANKADTPYVPRLPRVETESSICGFYWIRCVVKTGSEAKPGKISAEELLAVSIDKVSRAISAERIFYRARGD